MNGLVTSINAVHVLGSSKKLNYTQEGRFLKMDLSAVEQDELITTIVVEYSDAELRIDPTISQGSDNTVRLDRISDTYNKDELLSSWEFAIHTPGKYMITIISNEKEIIRSHNGQVQTKKVVCR